MILNSLQESITFILQNNSSSDFIRALIIFFISFIFLYLLKILGSNRTSIFFKNLKVRKIEEKINFIRQTVGYGFFMVLPVYLFLININFGPRFTRFFDILFLVVILFYLVKVVHILISVMAQRVIIKEEKKDKDFDPSFIHFIDVFLKILI
ncbi:MAG: hypothetical protein PF569_00555 [Candidatus Woesearchaeota archaeon]|jgi:hypothetical protein|nr:hypothetical protein [Candidatus Woesearchaeota archaeon]